MPAAADFVRATLPHREVLHRGALRMVHDPRLAEDLVQETYTRAYAAWARFEPGSNARAWLFRILVNAVVDEQRRSWRSAPLDDDRVPDESGLGPERAVACAEEHAALHRALAELPPALRGVVELVEFEGLRYREAAARLGVPVGTVMSRLSRARDRLYATLSGAAPVVPLRARWEAERCAA